MQFTINIFPIYFLISVNEVTFYVIYKIFGKILFFILGARFFGYLIDVLGARTVSARS